MNAINLNYMTRSLYPIVKNASLRTASGKSMSDMMAEYGTERVSACISQMEEVSTADMSMEQYKEYIHDKISRIPVHPSQAMDTVSIHISEAGFEAMKNDSEYEKWVLDRLKQDFAFQDPWSSICGGHYVIHSFGAAKEEYRGESWYPEYQNGKGKKLYEEKSKNSFWERRADMKKQLAYQMQRRQQSLSLKQDEYAKLAYQSMLSSAWQSSLFSMFSPK